MAQSSRSADLVSVADYLAGEAVSSLRHEFVAGRVYAMAGASERHNIVRLNIAGLLNSLVDEPCRVFDGDMKLRIEQAADTRFYHPDVFVACEPADQDGHVRDDAVLVIEVLSPTTERVDRYEKLAAYTRLPMLQEYALVDQQIPQIEVYRRSLGWPRDAYGPSGAITFESIGKTLTFDQIYRRVTF